MQTPSKAQQFFLYIAPFPALFFFKIWASYGRDPDTLLIAALAMLTYSLFIVVIAFHWDRPTYFDWAVAAYFLVVVFALAAWPRSAGGVLSHYAVTGIYSCLFSAAFFPFLLGMDPFTYHYAKKYTPETVWDNPFFVQINRVMTYVWSGIFAICILLSLYPSILTRAFIPIGLIVGFGLPFNLRYPDYYLKRLGLPSLAKQREMAERGGAADAASVPSTLPTTAWEAVSGMPEVFNPEAAKGLEAVIGFYVSGPEAFNAYLKIKESGCTLHEELTEEPDLVIDTPSDVWLAIARGELDWQRAFAKQAYKAKGNLGILMKMSRMFNTSTQQAGIVQGRLLNEKRYSKGSE